MLALVTTVALMLAAMATASQASASTLYACVKKNGSAKIYSKKPKCKKGETKESWGTTGAAGKNGTNGTNGGNGSNGNNGAVAGYGAVQTSAFNITNITNAQGFTQVPGLAKTLPAGSFIASGNIEIDASGEHEKETASGACEMTDTPTSGATLVQEGRWVSWLNNLVIIIITTHIAEGQISFHMAITNGVSSTLAIKCYEIGEGNEVTESAVNGSLTAIQTSSNS